MDIYTLIEQSPGGLVHQDGLIAGFDGEELLRIWQPANTSRLRSKAADPGKFELVAELEWEGLPQRPDGRLMRSMLDRFCFPWEAVFVRQWSDSTGVRQDPPELTHKFISLEAAAEYVFGQLVSGYRQAGETIALEDIVARRGARDLMSSGRAYWWRIEKR